MKEMSDEERVIRFLKHHASLRRRIWSDLTVMTRTIIRLVEKDIEARCPDHWEEIDRWSKMADASFGWYLGILEADLARRKTLSVDNSVLQKHIYDLEERRSALTNLYLDMYNWLREFEGVPVESERLEMLMELPSAEEMEEERERAYATGGGSLLSIPRPAGGPLEGDGRRLV